ncbi:hypothetical protein BACCIP111895_01960 [Neobacillus rhizosphaerae]|uniref:KTSC domain-containing protein n=1 Tax=Neobacillus rhizosphaerae TaxID=2880965 RepID=A0ABN8KQS5_9BACI|nr:hypothetical protein [Neobacillus rhizosphaerae]CAH2714784.1 hypothetical protein BACCIP111895_01960 [Neobacillus rhizosphaerae]
MYIIHEWLSRFWDWFWYFRRGKIRYHVFDFGDTYNAMASDGKVAVFHCYGSTPEAAKEMAFYRMRRVYEKEE